MQKKMLLAYIKENGLNIYDSEEISDIISAGDRIIFNEVSECGYYKDQRVVYVIDILVWLYSKTSNNI